MQDLKPEQWQWRGVVFTCAGEIKLRIGEDGTVAINRPTIVGGKYDGRPLHKYADLPFCWIEIKMPRLGPGVYVFFVNGTPVYVGVTKRTMYERFAEYRNINPRKCLRDGQPQSCRLNNRVLQTYLAGDAIDVYYTISADIPAACDLEDAMIADLQPPWNIHGLV